MSTELLELVHKVPTYLNRAGLMVDHVGSLPTLVVACDFHVAYSSTPEIPTRESSGTLEMSVSQSGFCFHSNVKRH